MSIVYPWSKTTLSVGTLALCLAMGALPLAAQQSNGEPAALTAAQIAPALIRTDAVLGAYEVAHWAEEGMLFVASSPSFDGDVPGYVHVFDASDLRPIRRVQLPRRAFALALDRSTGQLYAGNTLDGSLTVIDAKGGTILDTIQLGQPEDKGFEHVRMIVLDEQRGLAFVTGPGQKGVTWIVDTKARKMLHRIDTGLWTAGAAYDAGAGRLYVSGGGIEEISVIDVASGQRVGGLSTGDTSEEGGDACLPSAPMAQI